MTVPRSLVAYERGAVGPSKDCAYEGPFLKAITGYPIAMEGAEAACAHPSPVGNIAKAAADLWSNESVQNVKLLGGMAPTVSMEQLAYATRLMNVASANDKAVELRDWLVESDAALDPQAYILRPDVVLELAAEIVAEPTPYLRTRRAALAALQALRGAAGEAGLTLSRAEQRWLTRLSEQAEQLPEDEDSFIDEVVSQIDSAEGSSRSVRPHRGPMNSVERVGAAIELREPDRVPVDLHNFQLAARASGMPMSQVFRDGELLAEAMLTSWREFGHDMILLENGTGCNAEACGVEVHYRDDTAPVAGRPILDSLAKSGRPGGARSLRHLSDVRNPQGDPYPRAGDR